MLTLTFNISLNNTNKKVACAKSQSVNQLVQAALEKFRINGQHGELFHNGKKLDSSLSIRLTNLVNNSKLVLVVSDESKEKLVNIKLAINAKNEIKSYILKTSNIRSLIEILEEFERSNTCDIRGAGEFELTVLNSKIGSGSDEINSSLKSIIGSDVSSLVMRLVYLQINSNAEEQQKINEIQKQRMKDYQRQEKDKKELEQKAQEETARQKSQQQHQQQQQSDQHQIQTTTQADDFETPKAPESTNIRAKRQLIHAGTTDVNPSEAATTEHTSASEGFNQTSSEPIEHKDTLYIPSSFSTYENPDDDYEVTVDQAQKYHKMILNSSKKSAAPRPKPKPSKYSIRIKFPDRLMLQLEVGDPSAKLGNLLKKIDEYLLPEFQNNYNLKIGYPPFSKIPMTLTHNNTSLADSPFFQDEKIVLIWESLTSHTKGPYIVESDFARENIKRIDELPEIKLETNRSNLPTDSKPLSKIPPVPSSGSLSHNSEKPSVNVSKKVPKWFKPNK